MPRLSQALSEENRIKIEQAALRCFLKRGFHGASVREIAEAAGMSLGNVYNYFPDKLSLFRALLASHEAAFLDPANPVIGYFLDSDFPDNLESLASAIGDNVDRFADYFKLIYIDVIEFEGDHIRDFFSDLDRKFAGLLGARKSAARRGLRPGIRPSFAATAVYLSFYQYFTLTKLFGAKNIYGRAPDTQVIGELIRLLTGGILTHA